MNASYAQIIAPKVLRDALCDAVDEAIKVLEIEARNRPRDGFSFVTDRIVSAHDTLNATAEAFFTNDEPYHGRRTA